MIEFQRVLDLKKLFVEQSYAGNIGMMEMMTFYKNATTAQKQKLEELIRSKKTSEAWDLIKLVTHIQLEKV